RHASEATPAQSLGLRGHSAIRRGRLAIFTFALMVTMIAICSTAPQASEIPDQPVEESPDGIAEGVYPQSGEGLGSVQNWAASRVPTDSQDQDTRIPGHYIVVLRDSVNNPATIAKSQTEEHNGTLGFVYSAVL